MLSPPFPSSPTRLPCICINFKNTELGIRFVLTFAAMYAAKRMYDTVIADAKLKWLDVTTVTTSDGLVIRGGDAYDLEKLVEYEYTAEEKKWQLPEPYATYARQLRGEIKRPSFKTTVDEEPKPTAAPKAARVEGGKTAADLAVDLNMEPGKVRSKLRKLNVPKPYSWDASAYTKILARVRA